MTLIQALMNGHDFTLSETFDTIKKMRQAVKNGADPEEVLYEYGLEPDYIMDLLDY